MVLCLETATKNCSVALVSEGELIHFKEEHGEKFVHGERLHELIQELIKEADVKPSDIESVCVSKGPGSYTGLRIGVSAAKGLCYAWGVPLYSVPTHACFNLEVTDKDYVLAVLDARRDEVYAQLWKMERGQASEATSVEAVVVEPESWSSLKEERVLVVGDSASKVERLLESRQSWEFQEDQMPSAKYVAKWLAMGKASHENVAYFEPYYLKDFIAEKSKKKWL
jgi:tRNA threonylcarbamoyladenosine biosynthesis protein TsaB